MHNLTAALFVHLLQQSSISEWRIHVIKCLAVRTNAYFIVLILLVFALYRTSY